MNEWPGVTLNKNHPVVTLALLISVNIHLVTVVVTEITFPMVACITQGYGDVPLVYCFKNDYHFLVVAYFKLCQSIIVC